MCDLVQWLAIADDKGTKICCSLLPPSLIEGPSGVHCTWSTAEDFVPQSPFSCLSHVQGSCWAFTATVWSEDPTVVHPNRQSLNWSISQDAGLDFWRPMRHMSVIHGLLGLFPARLCKYRLVEVIICIILYSFRCQLGKLRGKNSTPHCL